MHLFVETPQPNLSAGMQFLNGSYTSYFNRRHRRAGHLFQGRYKAQLVEEEVERVRTMLSDWEADPAVPELEELRSKPSLETIREVVAEEFGVDGVAWAKGRRSDSISRAVAAYLARRWFGYRSKDVAAALGYSSAGGVGQAMKRVEAADSRYGETVRELARRLTNG